MNIPLQCFPQNIIDQYEIMDLVDKDGLSISRYARTCMV